VANWTREALHQNLPTCPNCGAAKGDPCRTPSGGTRAPHQERGLNLLKTTQTRYTGAFGATVVAFTPQAKRVLEFDITNCPHCGTHHASLDGVVQLNGRVLLRCPRTGGRPMELIIKLFLNVP
jgi:hypothetical protein